MAKAMSCFLDKLDMQDQLAKTIVYNLNPVDNALIVTMVNNFNDGRTPGKMQFGSGWWYMDQKYGMTDQLNTLSSLGLLSRFVGMLTDSRSFLSYPRHEYFRRILCNLVGTDVENGEIPDEPSMVDMLIKNVCYYNAKNYFAL
jgi:glucuronate isomerase